MKGNTKGISVWIWVIAGIIVGIILFTVFIQLLVYTTNAKEVQIAKMTFDELVYDVNSFCGTFGIAKTTKTFTFPDIVSRVYATNESKIQSFINGRSYGKILCMNATTEFLCQNVRCDVELSDIGVKNTLTTLVNKILGGFQSIDYQLNIQKTDCRVSIVNSGETPSSCA